MKQSRISIDAYFGDVLSGHFTPVTDQPRKHTLGRLASACVEKGDEQDIDPINDRLTTAHIYTPSWAEGTEVTAVTNVDYEVTTLQIVALRLAHGVHTLGIINRYAPDAPIGTGITIETGTSHVLARELGLGPNLQATRDLVAQEAQDFFMRAYPDIPLLDQPS